MTCLSILLGKANHLLIFKVVQPTLLFKWKKQLISQGSSISRLAETDSKKRKKLKEETRVHLDMRQRPQAARPGSPELLTGSIQNKPTLMLENGSQPSTGSVSGSVSPTLALKISDLAENIDAQVTTMGCSLML